MSSLSVFSFESNEIRFIDGKPVANDIAAALGYASPKDAIYRHVTDKNKGGADLTTPGGKQKVVVLEEAGIYQLIFSSKLHEAEKFQDWVFEEVLPSIRRTGKYEVMQPTKPSLLPFEEAEKIGAVVVKLHETVAHYDPRIAQILIDRAMQTLPNHQLLLPSTERLAGVVEIATDMQYSVGKEESPLGKACAAAYRKAYDEEPQISKRECGGAFRSLKVYRFDDPVIRAAIIEFYQRRLAKM